MARGVSSRTPAGLKGTTFSFFPLTRASWLIPANVTLDAQKPSITYTRGMRPRLLCSLLFVGLIGQQPAPPAPPPVPAANLPTAEATLKYLNQTIDWYRHVAEQEQFAIDASDTMFLNDDRQVSKQILKLSFDFA